MNKEILSALRGAIDSTIKLSETRLELENLLFKMYINKVGV